MAAWGWVGGGLGQGREVRGEEQGEAGQAAARQLCHRSDAAGSPGSAVCVLTFRPATRDEAHSGKVHVFCTSVSFHPSLRAVVPTGGQGRNHGHNSLSAFRKGRSGLVWPHLPVAAGPSLPLHLGLSLLSSLLSLCISPSLFLCLDWLPPPPASLNGLESSLSESLSQGTPSLSPPSHIFKSLQGPSCLQMSDPRVSLTLVCKQFSMAGGPFPVSLPSTPPSPLPLSRPAPP